MKLYQFTPKTMKKIPYVKSLLKKEHIISFSFRKYNIVGKKTSTMYSLV